MKIFEKTSIYQMGTSLRTWIMTIAKNITYDYFRKIKAIVPFEDNQVENATSCLSEPYENAIAHIELEKALKKLPGLDAQIAVLYAVCGYKHKELLKFFQYPKALLLINSVWEDGSAELLCLKN